MENTQSTYYSVIATDKKHKHRDTIFDEYSINVVKDNIVKTLGNRLNKGLNWLDIGCGVGKAAIIAKQIGTIKYTGIDVCKENINKCKNDFKEFDFINDDFSVVKLSNKYDLVTFFSSLHHIEDWKYALEKALSILNENGVIIIEQEPTAVWSKIYGLYLKMFSKDYKKIKDVELHWLKYPSINPGLLVNSDIQYHYDFIPLIRHLKLKTSNSLIGKVFPLYRAVIRK